MKNDFQQYLDFHREKGGAVIIEYYRGVPSLSELGF